MLQRRFFCRVVELKPHFEGAPSLPFADVLSEVRITAKLQESGIWYRDRVYTPCVSLWTFLSQVLSEDHSCREALSRFLAFRIASGLKSCSTDTGSYCQTRQRLPEELVSGLVRETGRDLHGQVPDAWKKGRCVKVLDGSMVSMTDTKAK